MSLCKSEFEVGLIVVFDFLVFLEGSSAVPDDSVDCYFHDHQGMMSGSLTFTLLGTHFCFNLQRGQVLARVEKLIVIAVDELERKNFSNFWNRQDPLHNAESKRASTIIHRHDLEAAWLLARCT